MKETQKTERKATDGEGEEERKEGIKEKDENGLIDKGGKEGKAESMEEG